MKRPARVLIEFVLQLDVLVLLAFLILSYGIVCYFNSDTYLQRIIVQERQINR